MKKRIFFALVFAATGALVYAFWPNHLGRVSFWQRLVSPGELARAHASLTNNCAACHTAVSGVDDVKCIACHANNESLLQRKPTAFHASIGNCRVCHIEHQGADARLTVMDHTRLAEIGLRLLEKSASDSEQRQVGEQLITWMSLHEKESGVANHPQITAKEMILNCWNCHATIDRHNQLFGRDCAACHSTGEWRIAEFRHPSPRSIDCAQCHKAPPSHYMEHFRMISQRVAGEEHAQVNECYRCHQTTSWNDIRGVGWYKHH